MAIKAFFTGLTMAVLRAAGEFGATILFAGNLEGRTQTLTTAIYTLSQNNFDLAIALAVILMVLFLVPIVVIKFMVD